MNGAASGRRWTVPLAGLVFLLAVMVYIPAMRCGFVEFDDTVAIVENPHIRHELNLSSVRWALTTTYYDYWHPLTWLTHMLDVQLYGLNPAGHHLTNVVLHALNASLFFCALMVMTGSGAASLAAAALFATHPIHVESVAWVVERKDLLCGLFFLLTIVAYATYASRGRRTWYAFSIVFYALALSAKPTAVVLPVVLLLLDWWPLARTPFEHRYSSPAQRRPATLTKVFLEKVPFIVLALVSAGVTYATFSSKGNIFAETNPAFRIGVALVGYATYLLRMVFPSGLAVLYPYPDRLSVAVLFGSVCVMGLLTALAFRLRRSHPWLLSGWLWFCAGLLPVAGLVRVGGQATADRFMYLPALGLYMAGPFTVAPFVRNRTVHVRRWAMIAAGALYVVLGALTIRQLQHWISGRALFARAVRMTRNNAIMHNNLAWAYKKEGLSDSAEVHFRKAIAIAPTYASPSYGLGLMHAQHGDHSIAADYLSRALRFDSETPHVHLALGQSLAHVNRNWEALEHLLAARRKAPDDWQVHHALGLHRLRMGQSDSAVASLRQAVELDPRGVVATATLGHALLEMNRTHTAEAVYRDALHRYGDTRWLLYGLARSRLEQGACSDALSALARVAEPTKAFYLLRGQAHACAGDKERAAADLRKAAELTDESSGTHE